MPNDHKVLMFEVRNKWMFHGEWVGLFDIKAEKSDGHINALKFKGVLLLLDEPSQRPPNGSHGHKILIPTDVAKKNLDTLLGMGIDYEDSFDKHNPKKKVGVIQKAWIDGNKLMCSGIIWKKDFPDIEAALDDKQLGMSFEGSNIMVEDPKATVWKITDVCFTGAAILYKTAAAYQKTEALAAAADSAICAELVYIRNGGKSMSQKAKKDKGRRRVSAAGETNVVEIGKILQKALKPLAAAISAQTSAISAMSASFEEFQEEQLETIAANGAPGMMGKNKKKGGASSSSEGQSSESSEEAAASSSASSSAAASSAQAAGDKKKKKLKASKAASSQEGSAESASSEEAAAESSEEAAASSQEAAASSAEGSLESMDESIASSSETPGHLNKDANENKGRKTTVSTHGDKHPTAKLGVKASGRKYRKIVRKIMAEANSANEAAQTEIKKLRKKVKSLQAQAEAAYNGVERKSAARISPKLQGLLEKGGLDVSAMGDSDKITVNQMDALLDKMPSLGSRERMAFKAEATRAGIMDPGEVVRN